MLTIVRGQEAIKAEAERGEKLIEILSRAGVEISAPCGGRCFCGKCLVRAEGQVGEILDAERKFISEKDLHDGWRLACACTIEGDATVYVGENKASVLVDGAGSMRDFNPAISYRRVTCKDASLTEQISDAGRLSIASGTSESDILLPALMKLPDILRENGGKCVVEEFNGKITNVYSEFPKALGCSVDIGTTTMAGYLVDLLTGETIATASCLNPQRAHGGDVISRVDYTIKNENGLKELSSLVRSAVVNLAAEMLEKTGNRNDDIKHIALVGNTIMMHIFAGLTVKHIATMPFVPAYSAAMHVSAKDMSLPFNSAVVTLGSCVAGYVGADTVAAAIACDMDISGKPELMLDIGTNGEIALRAGENIWCCSAAAGPAFEGAQIRCGSGAVDGAIDAVKITDGKVTYTTIGNAAAKSICGSGIVSAVSAMLNAEIIDETGRMDIDFCETINGEVAFRISDNVYITQKDIREVQLAKSAIAAGIGVLIDEAGIRFNDIEKLYLAGGFGNYIDAKCACDIGLIPRELLSKIVPVGNAAGFGVRKFMCDKSSLSSAEDLRERMRYIELSASADFQERFADNMLFE